MATRADIEINVKGLKKVQELSKQLDKVSGKVNQLNKSGGGGARAEKQAAASEEKRAASMVRVRNIGDQIQRAKEAGLKTDRASRALDRAALANDKGKLTLAKAHMKSAMTELEAEKATTKEIRNQIRFSKLLAATRSRGGGGGGGFTRPDKFNDRSNAAAARSGLISGAFPLLFGQGPIGGAAGFAGGFVGTKMGGQMGGFAGGLVATAVLQQLTTLRDSMTELGQAFSPVNINIDQSLSKLKSINAARASEIKLIEQFEGKQAALAEITKDTAKIIGEDGVRALREFAESMKDLSNSVGNVFLRIQAELAKVFEAAKGFTGGDFKDAVKNLGEDDELVKRLRNLEAREAEFFDRPADPNAAPGLSSSFATTTEGRLESKRLQQERNLLETTIKIRNAKQFGARFDKAISIENENLKKSMQGQLELDKQLLSIRKDGLSPEIAKQVLLLDQSNQNVRTGIENEIKSIDALIAKEKESGATYNDKIMLLELQKFSLQDQLLLNEELNKEERERIINQLKLNKAAKETQDAFDNITRSVQNDLKEGIKGLIKGTSTLADMLNNVADKFLDLALNQALFGNAGGSTVTGGLFKFLGFARGGRPPVGKPSIVGEKGPELFVPRSSGSIVPNNKLGGGGTNNVVVNVDASGSDVQGDDAGGQELGTLIAVAVQGELVKQQRPGGLLNR